MSRATSTAASTVSDDPSTLRAETSHAISSVSAATSWWARAATSAPTRRCSGTSWPYAAESAKTSAASRPSSRSAARSCATWIRTEARARARFGAHRRQPHVTRRRREQRADCLRRHDRRRNRYSSNGGAAGARAQQVPQRLVLHWSGYPARRGIRRRTGVVLAVPGAAHPDVATPASRR